MKKALVILITLGVFCFAPRTFAAYTYYRAITVTSTTSIASGTLTSFPMLVSSTLASWETSSTSGGAGHIQNLCTAPNGGQEPCDLVFATSTGNCGTANLNFETESYVSSTGALVDWVNVPTMTAGTTIYACYDNQTVATDQSQPSSTWNGNYVGVYHMDDDRSTETVIESTGAGNNATATLNTNSMSTSTFLGPNTGFILNASSSFNAGYVNAYDFNTSNFTVQYWFSVPSYAAQYTNILSEGVYGGTGGWYFFTQDSNDSPSFWTVSHNAAVESSFEPSKNIWYELTFVVATSTSNFYINGQQRSTAVAHYSLGTSTQSFVVGGGIVQDTTELRLSNTNLSPSWILTEYNNQSSPSTFYTMGGETAVGFAWGDRASWVNFGTQFGNVQVTASTVTGYAWSQNFGWINLAPSGTGVTNDGLGDLQGYAWSEAAGWINFAGVTISNTGTFVGIASGTLAGNINFNCSYCLVNTNWRPSSAAITVSNPLVNNGSTTITLTPATTTTVTITASTTDSAGAGDITYATSTFYRTSLGQGCSANNLDCYQVPSSSCSFSGSTTTVTCTANVWYFAQSTGVASATYPSDSWTAAITVSGATAGAGTGLSSPNVNVGVLSAVNVTTPSINYGAVADAQDTGMTDQTTSIQNAGNSSTTLQVWGTPLTSTGGYQYYRAITVTSTTSIASGTNSFFPMLVSSTLATWETSSTGGGAGHIQNLCAAPNGGQEPCDLVFATSLANCSSSPLNFETESYTSSTGALVDWVNVPTMQAGATIYACYDNQSVASDQSHPSSTWNSSYAGVWHLPAPTSTLNLNDSTANANNGTNSGLTATSTGQIDGAASGNGSAYATLSGTNNFSHGDASSTISGWVYATTYPTTFGFVMSYGPTSGNDVNRGLSINGGGDVGFNSNGNDYTSSLVVPLNGWHFIAAVYSGSKAITLYLDSSSQSGTLGSLLNTTSGVQYLGSWRGGNQYEWVGSLDEINITKSALTPSWIATEYNNQNNPSTFYSMGSEQSLGIPASSEHYATSSFTYGGTEAILSNASTTVPGFLLTAPTSTNFVSTLMYWGISIPSSTPVGIYSGVNTFVSTFSP